VANDVVIEVEARVGDAIAQMTLTAAAVRALGDAGSEASNVIGDDTDHRSLSSRLGLLRNRLSNIGDRGPLGTVVRGFGNLASAMLAPIDEGFKFAQNFERMGTVAQSFVGVGSSLVIGLAAIASAIAVVTFAAEALASIFGTLVAIVADLVAPVTLLTGLLGSLGLGFVLAAKRALEGGHNFKELDGRVASLQSGFHRFTTLLAQRLNPYFLELADAAKQALNFLDKIVKLPLEQAFKAIDTQGVQMLGKFVDRVAEVLSKPIRLAFHVAFQDTAFSNMVADWWHRFTGFLFGETVRHPVEIRPGVFKILPRTVDGVFQPFINWFNRHHFTQQGIQIGQQILRGIMNSGMRGRIIDFFVQIFKDAARRAFSAVRASAFDFVKWWGSTIKSVSSQAWNSVRNIVGNALSSIAGAIRNKISAAWNAVVGLVRRIWNDIVSFIESPISINIDWPSPPSWLSSLPGSGIVGGLIHTAGGIIPHAAGGVAAMPRTAMAAPNVLVQIHQADLSDGPTQRRIAGQVGRAIQADWRRRAGGH
jgi:hypothetical protein